MVKTNPRQNSSKVNSDEIIQFCLSLDKAIIRVSKFYLKSNKNILSQEDQKTISSLLIKHNMVDYYKEKFSDSFAIPNNKLLEMNNGLHNEIKKIDLLLKEEENILDVFEKRYINLKKAKILSVSGKKSEAEDVYKVALKLSTSPNKKLTVLFELIKLQIYMGDKNSFQKYFQLIDEQKTKSVDWEKRNQLKVYEAIRHITGGNFSAAADLCAECLTTFASEDLLPFEDLVFYSVTLGSISFNRVTFLEKIVESPEIVATIDQIAYLKDFLTSVYDCKYSNFFPSLGRLKTRFEEDRFLKSHFDDFERAAKRVVYQQFLESYVCVELSSFSNAFAVPVEQIDSDLFDYITNGDLDATIDNLSGVVHRKKAGRFCETLEQTLAKGESLSTRSRSFLNALIS